MKSIQIESNFHVTQTSNRTLKSVWATTRKRREEVRNFFEIIKSEKRTLEIEAPMLFGSCMRWMENHKMLVQFHNLENQQLEHYYIKP